MPGPIVRSGANPEFSDGWDRIFGQGAKKTQPDSPQKDSLDEEGHEEVDQGGSQESRSGSEGG